MCLAYCQTFYDQTDIRQNAALNAFLQARISEAWLWGPWPEWSVCERRGFADPWNTRTTYAADEVVFVRGTTATTDAYYVALRTTTGEAPATSATAWQLTTTPTGTTIALAQAGYDRIGRIWSVGSADMKKTTNYLYYDWTESPDGIYVLGCGLAAPWVHYTKAAPAFSTMVWTEGAQYQEGDVVLSPQTEATGIFPHRGECYRAAYDLSGNQVWVEEPFPAALARFVAAAVGSDMQLQFGKPDDSERLESKAYVSLADEARKAGIRPGTVEFRGCW